MDISPKIMKETYYFSKKFAHELRSGNCLARWNNHYTHFGIESIANIAPNIWNTILTKPRKLPSLVLKSKIKKWIP